MLFAIDSFIWYTVLKKGNDTRCRYQTKHLQNVIALQEYR